MCIEREDPYPISAVFYHLSSVVVPGNDFLKNFVGLL